MSESSESPSLASVDADSELKWLEEIDDAHSEVGVFSGDGSRASRQASPTEEPSCFPSSPVLPEEDVKDIGIPLLQPTIKEHDQSENVICVADKIDSSSQLLRFSSFHVDHPSLNNSSNIPTKPYQQSSFQSSSVLRWEPHIVTHRQKAWSNSLQGRLEIASIRREFDFVKLPLDDLLPTFNRGDSTHARCMCLPDPTPSLPHPVCREINRRAALIRGDISTIRSDCIVKPTVDVVFEVRIASSGGNSRNSNNMLYRFGFHHSDVIHSHGGAELDAVCASLPRCPAGGVRVSPAFNLPSKYVVHAHVPCGGSEWSTMNVLERCYIGALKVARTYKCRSISFGVFGVGGASLAANVMCAVRSIRKYLDSCYAENCLDEVDVIQICVDPGLQHRREWLMYHEALTMYFPRNDEEAKDAAVFFQSSPAIEVCRGVIDDSLCLYSRILKSVSLANQKQHRYDTSPNSELWNGWIQEFLAQNAINNSAIMMSDKAMSILSTTQINCLVEAYRQMNNDKKKDNIDINVDRPITKIQPRMIPDRNLALSISLLLLSPIMMSRMRWKDHVTHKHNSTNSHSVQSPIFSPYPDQKMNIEEIASPTNDVDSSSDGVWV